jgi:hypothetical protein
MNRYTFKVISRMGHGVRYFKTKREVTDFMKRNGLSKYEVYVSKLLKYKRR